MGTWSWEEISADRSGSSGDLAKLFRNESVKQPGIISDGAPPADATTLAREVIQNSWDAGIALERQLVAEGAQAPEFELRFVYRSLVGQQKAGLVEAIGLAELAARAGRDASARRALGLKEADCLNTISDPTVPLRLLQIEESGTTGMGGPWDQGIRSKLYLGLVSVGFTIKAAGSGGSYGYGKAGLIRGSAIHSVLAHTCFREDPAEPGVTSRLLGMTYWGLHEQGDASFTGFARLGKRGETAARPWENAEADEIAAAIGLPTRDPSFVEDLGSTFLLVDPVVEPHDLVRAVERNWWPAIEDGLIDIEVELEDGRRIYPKPKQDPVLRTFIRGYELALNKQDNTVADEFRKALGDYRPQGGPGSFVLGDLGLVADRQGWSYPNQTAPDASDPKSLVALIRGPRMVVEYLALSGNPCVRGAFVADQSIDDLLRQTEPKAHDQWRFNNGDEVEEEGVDPIAPKVAKATLDRLRKRVNEFRKSLKPPPPRQKEIRLPLLEDLFRNVLETDGSKNPPPPPPDARPVAITTKQSLERASDRTIRLKASASLYLTPVCSEDEVLCRVRFRCAIDEDGSIGDGCAIELGMLPGDFEVETVDKRGTTLVGTLRRTPTEFELVSAAYDMDWSMQFFVNADLDAAMIAEEGMAVS